MKIMTAEVVDGRVDVPAGSVHDGQTVTLLIHEPDELFELSEQQREELLAAMAQAQRGETVDGWELLDEIRG